MSYKPGDKIFAKVRGHPHWPARINLLPPDVKIPKGKYAIFFYGTHEVYYLTSKDIFPYEKCKNKFGVTKPRAHFVDGLKEIEVNPDVLLYGKDPRAESFLARFYTFARSSSTPTATDLNSSSNGPEPLTNRSPATGSSVSPSQVSDDEIREVEVGNKGRKRRRPSESDDFSGKKRGRTKSPASSKSPQRLNNTGDQHQLVKPIKIRLQSLSGDYPSIMKTPVAVDKLKAKSKRLPNSAKASKRSKVELITSDSDDSLSSISSGRDDNTPLKKALKRSPSSSSNDELPLKTTLSTPAKSSDEVRLKKTQPKKSNAKKPSAVKRPPPTPKNPNSTGPEKSETTPLVNASGRPMRSSARRFSAVRLMRGKRFRSTSSSDNGDELEEENVKESSDEEYEVETRRTRNPGNHSSPAQVTQKSVRGRRRSNDEQKVNDTQPSQPPPDAHSRSSSSESPLPPRKQTPSAPKTVSPTQSSDELRIESGTRRRLRMICDDDKDSVEPEEDGHSPSLSTADSLGTKPSSGPVQPQLIPDVNEVEDIPTVTPTPAETKETAPAVSATPQVQPQPSPSREKNTKLRIKLEAPEAAAKARAAAATSSPAVVDKLPELQLKKADLSITSVSSPSETTSGDEQRKEMLKEQKKKEKLDQKKREKLQELTTEAELILINREIKSSLTLGQEDYGNFLAQMDALYKMEIPLPVLVKCWELINTIRKCRRYKRSEEVKLAAQKVYDKFLRIYTSSEKEEIVRSQVELIKLHERWRETPRPSGTEHPPSSVNDLFLVASMSTPLSRPAPTPAMSTASIHKSASAVGLLQPQKTSASSTPNQTGPNPGAGGSACSSQPGTPAAVVTSAVVPAPTPELPPPLSVSIALMPPLPPPPPLPADLSCMLLSDEFEVLDEYDETEEIESVPPPPTAGTIGQEISDLDSRIAQLMGHSPRANRINQTHYTEHHHEHYHHHYAHRKSRSGSGGDKDKDIYSMLGV